MELNIHDLISELIMDYISDLNLNLELHNYIDSAHPTMN